MSVTGWEIRLTCIDNEQYDVFCLFVCLLDWFGK